MANAEIGSNRAIPIKISIWFRSIFNEDVIGAKLFLRDRIPFAKCIYGDKVFLHLRELFGS